MSIRRYCHPETQRNPGAMPFAATEPDAATEALHDALYQHQPYAQPTLLGGEKRPERHALLLFVHAFAVVGKAQCQVTPVVTHHLHTQPPTMLHGLQGVGDQAAEN